MRRAVFVVALFLLASGEFRCAHAESPLGAEVANDALVRVCGYRRVWALGDRHYWGSVQRSMARESARYLIPISYLAAVIASESTCDPEARSRRGAVGLMQVLPTGSAARGIDPLRFEEYSTNIHAGARHLKRCLEMCVDLLGAFGVYNGSKTCHAGRESSYAWRTFQLVLRAEGKRS